MKSESLPPKMFFFNLRFELRIWKPHPKSESYSKLQFEIWDTNLISYTKILNSKSKTLLLHWNGGRVWSHYLISRNYDFCLFSSSLYFCSCYSCYRNKWEGEGTGFFFLKRKVFFFDSIFINQFFNTSIDLLF